MFLKKQLFLRLKQRVEKMATKTEKMNLERLVKQGTDLEVSEEEKYRKKGKRHKITVSYKTHSREIKTK